MTPEFSRLFALDTIGTTPRDVAITADEAERAALAGRFALQRIDMLTAETSLVACAAGVEATGRIVARVVQYCAATGEPVPVAIDEPFTIRFVDPVLLAAGDTEVELNSDDLDVVALDGGNLDLGEAAAQTLGLALDPFPRSPKAPPEGEVVWRSGPDAGPFAGLKGLLGEP